MKYTPELSKAVKAAVVLAQENKHSTLFVEHVLLKLLDTTEVGIILENSGANLDKLEADLTQYLTTAVKPAIDEQAEPVFSLEIQMALQLALQIAKNANRDAVSPQDALQGILRQEATYAVKCLSGQNVSKQDILNFIKHGVSKNAEAASRVGVGGKEPALTGDGPRKKPSNPLELYCTNINQRVKDGKIDPVIGRADEIERVIKTLSRRRKNNAVLIGDAGVGKTAIAEGLAHKIIKQEVPKSMFEVIVYALDLAALVAGTRFRGDFEERLKAVVDAVKDDRNKVLFIDEIHMLIGAGSAGNSAMDASNILKPALANGQIRVIGSTTITEFREIFEKDNALTRRFQKIEVDEPSIVDAIKILRGLKNYYEDFHNVSYSEPAIEAAVELSARFITDRFLPDKAIDIIDEIGASVKLKNEGKELTERPKITVLDIENTVSKIARVPVSTVRKDDMKKVLEMPAQLKTTIFGQDKAIESVTRAIKVSKSGLGEPDKPIGAFLFAGPTGVGKTELAKQVAVNLGIDFVRFDMSEYQEGHTVSRLFGSPPGYIGHEKGGQLTEIINRKPHCVLLLDEVEKAHPDVYQAFLQIMDYGVMTDGNGRKVNFRNTIIIMTTNAGSFERQANSIGFTETVSENAKENKALEHTFTPEFRNRLTAIIQFNALTDTLVLDIVDKMVAELNERLFKKGIAVSLTAAAKSLIANKGYNKSMGARPVKRCIETEITYPLSEEILSGNISKGSNVIVDVQDSKVVFKAE